MYTVDTLYHLQIQNFSSVVQNPNGMQDKLILTTQAANHNIWFTSSYLYVPACGVNHIIIY